MRELGKDPLTWSFLKLFGIHMCHKLLEFEGVPASHAWRLKSTGLRKSRLLTKAQCIGVVVSMVRCADRVEIHVDDGTALVKTVLWGDSTPILVALGDLVHVEGKLNVDKNWDAVELSRELRVIRITIVEDPNKELLNWIQVMELTQTYSSIASEPQALQIINIDDAKSETHWTHIASQAFFSLDISPSTKQQFISRNSRGRHDETLVEMLESLLLLQNTSGTKKAITITFSDCMSSIGLHAMAREHANVIDKHQRIRALQYTFRELRRAGLLFMENDEEDLHVLLSFEAVLKPALLQLLQEYPQGRSIAEIADAILVREQFKCIPLQWIERSLEHLVASRLVFQDEMSQLLFIN